MQRTGAVGVAAPVPVPLRTGSLEGECAAVGHGDRAGRADGHRAATIRTDRRRGRPAKTRLGGRAYSQREGGGARPRPGVDRIFRRRHTGPREVAVRRRAETPPIVARSGLVALTRGVPLPHAAAGAERLCQPILHRVCATVTVARELARPRRDVDVARIRNNPGVTRSVRRVVVLQREQTRRIRRIVVRVERRVLVGAGPVAPPRDVLAVRRRDVVTAGQPACVEIPIGSVTRFVLPPLPTDVVIRPIAVTVEGHAAGSPYSFGATRRDVRSGGGRRHGDASRVGPILPAVPTRKSERLRADPGRVESRIVAITTVQPRAIRRAARIPPLIVAVSIRVPTAVARAAAGPIALPTGRHAHAAVGAEVDRLRRGDVHLHR